MTGLSNPFRRTGRQGFTLAEALLASCILLIGVMAVTVPFASAARNEQQDTLQTLGLSLAQEMMEEVLSKRFYDSEANAVTGPEPGETRSQFDSYDDYNGYSESAGHVANFQGQVCSDALAAGLSRGVSVAYVRVPGQPASDPSWFVQVTVTVSQNGREIVRLSRLAFAYP